MRDYDRNCTYFHEDKQRFSRIYPLNKQRLWNTAYPHNVELHDFTHMSETHRDYIINSFRDKFFFASMPNDLTLSVVLRSEPVNITDFELPNKELYSQISKEYNDFIRHCMPKHRIVKYLIVTATNTDEEKAIERLNEWEKELRSVAGVYNSALMDDDKNKEIKEFMDISLENAEKCVYKEKGFSKKEDCLKLKENRYCKSLLINKKKSLEETFGTYEFKTFAEMMDMPFEFNASVTVKQGVYNGVHMCVSCTVFGKDIEETKENLDKMKMRLEDFNFKPKTVCGFKDQKKVFMNSCLPMGELLSKKSFSNKFEAKYERKRQKRALQYHLDTPEFICCGFQKQIANFVFPWSYTVRQDKEGFYRGINLENHSPIFCNYKMRTLHHQLILGEENKNKKLYVKMEILQNLIKDDEKIIIIDPHGKYSSFVKKMNGQNLNISILGTDKDGKYHINPFDDFTNAPFSWNETYDEVCREEKRYTISTFWEEIMKEDLNGYETNLVNEVLERMYKDKKPDTEFQWKDFYAELEKDTRPEAKKFVQDLGNTYLDMNYHTNIEQVVEANQIISLTPTDFPTEHDAYGMMLCLQYVWYYANKYKEMTKNLKDLLVYVDDFDLLFTTESPTEFAGLFYRFSRRKSFTTCIFNDNAKIFGTRYGNSFWNDAGSIVIFPENTDRTPFYYSLLQHFMDGINDNIIRYFSGKNTVPNQGIIVYDNLYMPFEMVVPDGENIHEILHS